MLGRMLVFRLKPPQDPNVASDLVKKLYGQATSNHKGKYRYRRKGLLDEIPAHRLIRGVIIVKEADVKPVMDLLNDFDAEVFVRKVVLTADDKKALGVR
jgi:hypothetical protein